MSNSLVIFRYQTDVENTYAIENTYAVGDKFGDIIMKQKAIFLRDIL